VYFYLNKTKESYLKPKKVYFIVGIISLGVKIILNSSRQQKTSLYQKMYEVFQKLF